MIHNMNKISKLRGIYLLVLIFFVGCANDKWDEHYQADPAIVSDKNLWTIIEETPELSSLATILKNYGYDQLLSQTQAYTVFAPTNEALSRLDTTNINVKSELLDNHIARFFIPASGYDDVIVGTFNKKRIKLLYQDGSYIFGTAAFRPQGSTIHASNGMIHILDDYEKFFPNIYEYLAKRTDLDSIRKYIYSFDEILLDEQASVPGDVVNGKLTYLDSVFINSNQLIQKLGYINREDSSYTMVVPNNIAWTEAYNRIKEDFVYYNEVSSIADSLQRANASFAIVQDLIFSNTVQVSPKDSLYSTSRNPFYNPQYLFDGTESFQASNGTIYITNQLKYSALDSWHKPIKVECEHSFGRENTLSTAFPVMTSGLVPVSNGAYLRLSPVSSSGNPTATFEIPNTLSSMYDIYCVFVTEKVNNPNKEGMKPCKVYFNMSYINRSGKIENSRFPETGNIETNPNVIDTILVAPDFEFPTTNYGEKETTVLLKVLSSVSRSETTNYSRELLLDCILLKPKKK